MMRLLDVVCVLIVLAGGGWSSAMAFVAAPPSQGNHRNGQTLTRLYGQENKGEGMQRGIGGGFFKAVGDAFAELDAFVDDASARRLGNGAAFYGKRKSNFYGDQDKNKKADRSMPDPTEDYQGPTSTGLFMWQQDENGQMRPVTRMKNKVIERNPNFWDRVYSSKNNNNNNKEE